MITNNFNKELRGISDALRDLGYTDSTIGLRQRYWKEYCFFHGSLDIDEASMDEFLLKNYDIQSGNINVSKRQYEVRAALRNLLEYRRYGKIRNYHTPWFKDLPWVESFRAITEDFISHLRSQNSKPETIVNYERTLKRITNHLHSVNGSIGRPATTACLFRCSFSCSFNRTEILIARFLNAFSSSLHGGLRGLAP